MGYQISNKHIPIPKIINLVIWIILALLLLGGAVLFTVTRVELWWTIPVSIGFVAFGTYYDLHHNEKQDVFSVMTITIDEKGIRNDSVLYPWARIDHCYYYTRLSGRRHVVGLAIVKKNNDRVNLRLNGFRFKRKELVAAINKYSARKICHMTFKDVKHEIGYHLALIFFSIIVMFIYIMLLSSGQ